MHQVFGVIVIGRDGKMIRSRAHNKYIVFIDTIALHAKIIQVREAFYDNIECIRDTKELRGWLDLWVMPVYHKINGREQQNINIMHKSQVIADPVTDCFYESYSSMDLCGCCGMLCGMVDDARE